MAVGENSWAMLKRCQTVLFGLREIAAFLPGIVVGEDVELGPAVFREELVRHAVSLADVDDVVLREVFAAVQILA